MVYGAGISHSDAGSSSPNSLDITITGFGSQIDGILFLPPPAVIRNFSNSFSIPSFRATSLVTSSKDCAIRCSLQTCTLGINPISLVIPNPPSRVLEYRLASHVLGGKGSHSLTAVRIAKSRVLRYVAFASDWSAK